MSGCQGHGVLLNRSWKFTAHQTSPKISQYQPSWFNASHNLKELLVTQETTITTAMKNSSTMQREGKLQLPSPIGARPVTSFCRFFQSNSMLSLTLVLQFLVLICLHHYQLIYGALHTLSPLYLRKHGSTVYDSTMWFRSSAV